MGIPSSEKDEKKTVMVGVKMDARSKETLTWALVNLATTGDHFVACHVVSSPAPSSSSLNSQLDSMLAVYEGFCNLKQVELKMKICKGISRRIALVREAKSLGATKLILGSTRNKHKHGFSLSIAKYCARKLRSTCSVVAIYNGKIVYQSDGPDTAKPNSEQGTTKEDDLYCVLPPRILPTNTTTENPNPTPKEDNPPQEEHIPLSTSSNDNDETTVTITTNDEKTDLYCPWPVKENSPQAANENKSTSQADEADLYCSWPRARTNNGRNNCSVCTVSNEDEYCSSSLSNSPKNNKVIGVNGGSQSLRKRFLEHRRCHSSEWNVVKWAMRIPTRLHLEGRMNNNNNSSNSNNNNPVGIGGMRSSSDLKLIEDCWPPKELEKFEETFSPFCEIFGYDELEVATSNFCDDNLIGKGGTSRVYKGNFPEGRELAVKMLKPSKAALKEFMCEVETASCLHHANMISLAGFCYENKSLILVYNYLPNGSLEEILHGEHENKHVLSWEERYKIAVGVAEALDYLHTGGGSNEPVIHGDVKSSNILLSKDFEPQLSDFGFARRVSSPASKLTCNDIAGTFGYLAPEYFMYGKVNEKIDVYAYGVVLLELISGRKPIQAGSPKGHESIVAWAKPILHGGKMEELLDPCLNDAHVEEQMRRIIITASLCLKTYYKSRPTMSLVAKLLRGDEEATQWAELQVAITEENIDGSDDEMSITPPGSNIRSYLNLALLDLEDDSVSVASTDQTVDTVSVNASIEDYLDRWSRSSSFE